MKRVREGSTLLARRLAGHRGALPDFLVIGAQKAGTSSLFRYLMDHPAARAPVRKEIHYFDYGHARGEGWYRRFFPRATAGTFTGEASPSYLFHPDVPGRVAEALPDVALIAVLRRPDERAWSHYRHNVKKGREARPFLEAVKAEADLLVADADRRREGDRRHFSYLARGRYAEQLERWYRHVSRERLLVLTSDRLFDEPAEAYADVLRFLGLPDHRPSSFDVFNRGVAGEVADEAAEFLELFFREDNRSLEALLGRPLGWAA